MTKHVRWSNGENKMWRNGHEATTTEDSYILGRNSLQQEQLWMISNWSSVLKWGIAKRTHQQKWNIYNCFHTKICYNRFALLSHYEKLDRLTNPLVTGPVVWYWSNLKPVFYHFGCHHIGRMWHHQTLFMFQNGYICGFGLAAALKKEVKVSPFGFET